MKTTARDKWLMALIPALMTGIVYVFFIGGGAIRSLNVAHKQLEKTQEGPGADLSASRQVLAAVNARLTQEKQRAAAFNVASPTLPGIESTTTTRTNVLRVLSDLFASKDLILLKSTKLERESSKGLPAQTEALAKRLSDRTGLAQAEFWQLEMDGTYPNMLAALRAITCSGFFVVPISIAMEPTSSNDGELKWVLTVWI